MDFTSQDFDKAKFLAGLIKKIDALDPAHAIKISDDIFEKQPHAVHDVLPRLAGFANKASRTETNYAVRDVPKGITD